MNIFYQLFPTLADISILKYARTHARSASSWDNVINRIIDWAENGGNLNQKDSKGNTILYYTSFVKCPITEHLQKQGIKAPDDISLTSYLLAKGANANVLNNEQLTPLFEAFITGTENTPLIRSTDKTHLNILYCGETFLTALVSRFVLNFKTLRELCEAGADPNIPNRENKTPLECIFDNGAIRLGAKQALMQSLIQYGAKLDDKRSLKVVNNVLNSQEAQKIDLLLDMIKCNVVDLNARDEKGNTLLHLFAQASLISSSTDKETIKKQKKLFQQLAQHIDINATNNDNQTPLNLAITGEFGTICALAGHKLNCDYQVSLLTGAGADLNIPDIKGNTPLHNAGIKSDAPSIKKLLEKGADVTILNNNNSLPLQTARQDVKHVFLQHQFNMLCAMNIVLKKELEHCKTSEFISQQFEKLPSETQSRLMGTFIQKHPNLSLPTVTHTIDSHSKS